MRYLVLSIYLLTWNGTFAQKGPKPLPTKWFCQLQIQDKTIDFWLEQKPTRIFPPQYRIINGKEIIDLNTNRMEGDSIICPISIFDAELKFPYKSAENFAGRYRKNDSKVPGYFLDFTASQISQKTKAPKGKSVFGSWTTEWKIEFLEKGIPEDTGFGIFVQEKDSIFGSILTETGDYRYLNGKFYGNKAYLQTFDGAHTYRFDFERTADILNGIFTYSKTGRQAIRATKSRRNPLSDGSTKSKAKSDLKFTFVAKDLDGNAIDQNWEKLKGKALVVQLWGSWCPNCLDETIFMNEQYGNRPDNVEFVGLAFERKPDFEYAKSRVDVTKSRLKVLYPLLIAGISNKDSASKVLPSLSGVAAFPTTIFVKPDGTVFKVHTGFSGPATGIYYESWKKEFAEILVAISKPEDSK